MKSFDLLNAMGELDGETVRTAREVPAKTAPVRRRLPKTALIAAALAVFLSLSAAAYYAISHANTAALLETNPMTDSPVVVRVDNAGQQIIDDAAIDLGISQTSNGTTVTVDSIMGYKDLTESRLYLTFTVAPPEGFAFPEDMSYWCFWDIRYTAVPDDITIGRAEATVKNPDGTASVLWMLSPMGDIAGHKLHIEFGGFGMASKEVCEDLYMGNRTIDLPGHWTFDLDVPALPETQNIAFDHAAVKEAGLPMTALRLNSFGGVAELEKQELSALKQFRETYGEQLKTDFPTIDFGRMDDAEFLALLDSGDTDGFLTEDEYAHLNELIGSLQPWYLAFARPETLTLEYPDGTEYTVSYGTYGDNLWINWDDDGVPYCSIAFLNPQPISQATAIVINGIRIPLQ